MTGRSTTSNGPGGSTPDPTVRDRVLDAVVELAAERGLANVSVDDIAKRAGLSKTTMYTRWPDRQSLIRDAFTHITQIDDAAVDTAGIEFGPALTALLERTVPAPRPVVQMTAELIAHAGVDDALREVLDANHTRWIRLLEAVIRAGIDEGAVPADRDVARTAEIVAAVVSHAQIGPGLGRVGVDELRQLVWDLVTAERAF